MTEPPSEQDRSVPRDLDGFLAYVTPVLLRLAGPLAPSNADAQDLVQETTIRLTRYWSRVVGAQDPVAYARRVLVNESNRRFRGSRSVPVFVDMSYSEVNDNSNQLTRSGLDGVLDSAEVRWLLGHLSAKQRAAVVLRYLDDSSYAEIAEVLGCRPVAARSLVSRGLRELRAVHKNASAPNTTNRQD